MSSLPSDMASGTVNPVPPTLPPGVNRAGLWEEWERLRARRDLLQRQSRELAFQHYPTFIAAANTCRDIAADFRASRDQLSAAVERLPRLAAAAAAFRDSTAQVSARRKRTSLVLSKHTRLLEVLELPQLMETCVKNGYHEEALAIQQLCSKLHKPLGSVPLIQSVLQVRIVTVCLHYTSDAIMLFVCVQDVHSSSVWMLNQLLFKLKGPVQLPECLKIIGANMNKWLYQHQGQFVLILFINLQATSVEWARSTRPSSASSSCRRERHISGPCWPLWTVEDSSSSNRRPTTTLLCAASSR